MSGPRCPPGYVLSRELLGGVPATVQEFPWGEGAVLRRAQGVGGTALGVLPLQEAEAIQAPRCPYEGGRPCTRVSWQSVVFPKGRGG